MKSSSFLEWLRFMLTPIKYPLSRKNGRGAKEEYKKVKHGMRCALDISFENYCLRDYLKTASLLVIRELWQKKE